MARVALDLENKDDLKVLQGCPQRQLAQALAAVQPQYLAAWGGATTCFTGTSDG